MKKVLFGGAFDLLHYGHLLAIREARSYGDYLIVNVMSDERCRAKKGLGRPIIPAKERVEMVRALRDVDEVNCLEGNPDCATLDLLGDLRPDVLVMDEARHPNGAEIIGLCRELGIQHVQLDRVVTESGLDTTGIINKIKNGKF